MQDSRQIRQAIQTIVGLAMIVLPVALAVPFDWRALVTSALGGIMTLLTNPRLVPGLSGVMPTSGSSAALKCPSAQCETRYKRIAPPLFMLLLLCPVVQGCHNVTQDQFLGATVDCAKVNPEASSALAAVETCLVGIVAQNPAACLAGLVTEVHFAIDEVACLVAYVAQQNQNKVATGRYTSEDLRIRQAANDWLASERISIRNTYPTER
jgi:hypothetical protein